MAEMLEENVIKEKVKVLVLHPISKGTDGDFLMDPLATDCKNEEIKEDFDQRDDNKMIMKQDLSVMNLNKKQGEIDTAAKVLWIKSKYTTTTAEVYKRIRLCTESSQDLSTPNLMKSKNEAFLSQKEYMARFTAVHNLIEHMASVHNEFMIKLLNKAKEPNSPIQLKHKFCDASFTASESLIEHIALCHDEKKFLECQICNVSPISSNHEYNKAKEVLEINNSLPNVCNNRIASDELPKIEAINAEDRINDERDENRAVMKDVSIQNEKNVKKEIDTNDHDPVSSQTVEILK